MKPIKQRPMHCARTVWHLDRCEAFTLVELLVVMAIIAILAALLMPSLSKAKNQAAKVTDLNNLQQIMVAVHVYTSDDNDRMPPPNWDNGYGLGWLYNYNPAASGPETYNQSAGLIWPILHTAKIYVCPNDNLQMWHWSNHDQVTEQRRQQLSSYAMNGAVCGYDAQISPPMKISSFHPDDCAFWETDETEPFYFNDGANYPPEGVSGRHLAGGIQAAFGGWTDYVKLTEWYDQVTETNRNRLWCYPNSPDGRTY